MSTRFLTPTNVIALIILVGSSAWLAWWFYDRSQFVYVTDARISATMVNVSSRIPGWVETFPLDEGEIVEAGETLVTIDSRDTRLQLEEAEARLATLDAALEKKRLELELTRKQVASAIEAEKAKLMAAQAALSEADVGQTRMKKELDRARSLLAKNMISDDEFEARQAAYDQAVEARHRREAEVATARAELLSAEANLAQIDVLEKDVEIAQRERHEAKIERRRLAHLFEDHVIRSTRSAVIDETFINQGEYVYPGQRILMLHDPFDVWVKANVKETDIRNVRVGSPVTITVDAFPGKTLTGSVTNIGSAATSQFAMLPTPNPSGNFTKTTQRVEVRIDLDDHDVNLKPGMMVELRIPAGKS